MQKFSHLYSNHLENSPNQICMLIGLKPCLYNIIEAQNKNVMMAWAKRIYMLMIKVNELIFFFVLQYFLKEIENMFSVFLSS